MYTCTVCGLKIDYNSVYLYSWLKKKKKKYSHSKSKTEKLSSFSYGADVWNFHKKSVIKNEHFLEVLMLYSFLKTLVPK